jgi:hypothetical protein
MQNATSRLHTFYASAQDVTFSIYGFVKHGEQLASDLELMNQTNAAVVYGTYLREAGRKVISVLRDFSTRILSAIIEYQSQRGMHSSKRRI